MTNARWAEMRRGLPPLALSLALHAAILGPLCLITWAVTVAVNSQQVLTLSPDAPAGADADETGELAGGGPSGTVSPGGRPAAGAAGGLAAPGERRETFSLPAPPGTGGELAEYGKTLGVGQVGAGLPGGMGADNTGGLIRNLTAASGGPAGGGGLGGGRGDLLVGTSKDFGDYVGTLGGKGLDLVLVLDATDSMSPYIKQAKERLQEVLDVVTGLVPNARIGVVAYKDYGDDYGPSAVKVMKITNDADAIRRFIDDIAAGGGGDEPEPIHEALKAAAGVETMGWIAGRKRVMILVGDSTIHSSGREEARNLARKFSRDMQGVINVIDTGGTRDQDVQRQQVQPDLRMIAQEGKGSAFLLKEQQSFWRHLVVSVFGERFKDDVDVVLKKFIKKDEKKE